MFKVSVIITTYNYGDYICKAVDSVLGQTYDNTEIIIIDDGSVDDTPSLLRQYEDMVRYHRIPNSGQTVAKNTGASMASGDIIAFLDADDIWRPDKLEKQIPLFNDPEVGIVYSRRYWIDPADNIIEVDTRHLYRGQILEHILLDNFICFSSIMIRSTIWHTLGQFDERLTRSIDYDLWLRYSPRTLFDYCDEPLVYYRVGHSNMSQNKDKRFLAALDIMRKFLSTDDAKSLPTHLVRNAFATTYTNWAYYNRDGHFLRALTLYIKALMQNPLYLPAWKGLLWLHSAFFYQRIFGKTTTSA